MAYNDLWEKSFLCISWFIFTVGFEAELTQYLPSRGKFDGMHPASNFAGIARSLFGLQSQKYIHIFDFSAFLRRYKANVKLIATSKIFYY
jgi:hypothetical protein